MTKYQRGDLMEGWNDCPPPSLSRDSSSTSISSTRSKRRNPRLPGLGATAADAPAARRTPAAVPGAPPMARNLLSTPSLLASESQVLDSVEPPVGTANVNETPQKIAEVLKSSNLSEKDESLFTKKLVDAYPSLSESHKEFITQIVDQIVNKQQPSVLKGEILNYMMVNSGVSSWCVPLKKLVESL